MENECCELGDPGIFQNMDVAVIFEKTANKLIFPVIYFSRVERITLSKPDHQVIEGNACNLICLVLLDTV